MKPGSATLAIGVGYVLGRQHKLRTALMLGAAAAGGKLAASHGQENSQQGGDQSKGHGSGLVGKLSGAGKTAAISAFTRSADKLGDVLTERAASMRGGSGEDEK